MIGLSLSSSSTVPPEGHRTSYRSSVNFGCFESAPPGLLRDPDNKDTRGRCCPRLASHMHAKDCCRDSGLGNENPHTDPSFPSAFSPEPSVSLLPHLCHPSPVAQRAKIFGNPRCLGRWPERGPKKGRPWEDSNSQSLVILNLRTEN